MNGSSARSLPVDGVNTKTADPIRCWTGVLFVFSAWILFANLGGAALFEPDEGRNAEIAREIVILKDWITPHYDFIPRLDKPILYFDLVAVSYKLFGISEGSARLPSALAALGCILLTYGFARSLYGYWAALWSALILLTSGGFFGLSRIVILDMLLTLFITAALCCFFWGRDAVERGKGKIQFLTMYAAMGAATLTKGPIGFLIPGAVIFCYLFLAKKWMLLRHMEFGRGIPLFLLTTVPWYFLVELRNPGYLNYFFWQENVARFTTSHFKRSGPWYYFIAALSAGFLPWTVLLPSAIVRYWKRWRDEELLFLILWVALPVVFFSLSSAKLFHYILPVYPALAIIGGRYTADILTDSPNKFSWLPLCAAGFYFLTSALVVFVALKPDFLSAQVTGYVHTAFDRIPIQLVIGMVVAVMLVLSGIQWSLWRKQGFLFPVTCAGFMLFVLCAEPIVATVAVHRSSKGLAEKASPLVRDEDQLVIYDGYQSSLPFYLKIERPIWVVWSGTKSKVLGSDYVARREPEPAAGYGPVLLTYEEFAERWSLSQRRLVVFVDNGAVDRFEQLIGDRAQVVLQSGETLVLENRKSEHN